MLYVATCYIPYACLLFFSILIFPALACFPSLIRTPCLATAIPIISMLLVNTIALVLFKFDIYHHGEVIGVTVIIAVIALWRVYHFLRRFSVVWHKNDKYLIWLNAGILLPLLAFNGISVFMTNDAVRSWHYWSMFYYSGVVPDTEGYPPFFSLFISYCYQLLGTTEYQGPVKALLTVFPFTIMNAIAFMSVRTKEQIGWYLLLISCCVFPGFLSFGFYRFYSVGYADPLLAATIVTSLMLILQYFRHENEPIYLWTAVLCGATASLSKQPGMLWAGVSVPLLMVARALWFRKINYSEWVAMIVLIFPMVCWLVGRGSNFYHNPGVISASLHPSMVSEKVTWHDAIHTLCFSVNKYFIKQPSLFLLFVLAAIASFREIHKRFIFIFFLLPATLLWFILGSYDMRLGLYIVTSYGLLIASENYLLDSAVGRSASLFLQQLMRWWSWPLQKIASVFFALGMVAFIVFSFTDQKNPHINVPYRLYPLNAGLSYSYSYYGPSAEYIYKTIYNNPNIKIWAVNRYIQGVFYGHTPIVPGPSSMRVVDLYQNISQYKPDFVLVGFCHRGEPECVAVKQLIAHYPGLLAEIPLGKTLYDYHLYRLNRSYIF